jgi:hypothetical protein
MPMEDKMSVIQTLEGYVCSKFSLLEALVANGHLIADQSLCNALVNCLLRSGSLAK